MMKITNWTNYIDTDVEFNHITTCILLITVCFSWTQVAGEEKKRKTINQEVLFETVPYIPHAQSFSMKE